MEFLYFLEGLRNPVCDAFFSAITHLGSEIAFLVIALVVFWCVNKREGFYLFTVGFVGTVVNQVLKLVMKVPRPWLRNPNFTVVGDAKLDAGGYSFPSGHTQNVAGTLGGVGRFSSRLSVRIISIVLIVLVAFSRMYLGVHTPADVVFSLIFAALLVFLLHPIFENDKRMHKFMPYVIGALSLLSVVFVLIAFLTDPKTTDAENLYSAKKNASTILGASLALVPVYILDRKYIRFETKASWYVQAIKIIVGLAVAILIKSGLSTPLNLLFGNEFVGRTVRYFLIVIFAGILWPMCFKYLNRIKINALDNLFKKKNKSENE